jgi:hypothetical protein
MEIFTASGQASTDVLGASGSLIQASLGSMLDLINLIGTGLSTFLNDLLIPSMGYLPFFEWFVYYVDDVLLTPFLDVNAPQNPLVLNGFLLP